jgi:hypothetical protein
MKHLICRLFGHRIDYQHPSMLVDARLGTAVYDYRCSRCRRFVLRYDRLIVIIGKHA